MKSAKINTSTHTKSTKRIKDRDKRKVSITTSTATTCITDCTIQVERPPPVKGGTKLFAGLGRESIRFYADQLNEELTDEACDCLAEDLNYKLRYILQDALARARVSNRTIISSSDVDETFTTLSIEKVYGAPNNPIWLPAVDPLYLQLDDPMVSLREVGESEVAYSQPGDVVLECEWLSEKKGVNEALKKYFETMCRALVSSDRDLARLALQNISANRHIGPIIEWFYRYGYMLLSKNLTDNNLTIRALYLVEVLENSSLGSVHVSDQQLKLLGRLLLQRLLDPLTSETLLRQLAWVLAKMCRRMPLRELVLLIIFQKMASLLEKFTLPILMIVNCFGLDTMKDLFLENTKLFMSKLLKGSHSLYVYSMLETYWHLCKYDVYDLDLFTNYAEVFGMSLIVFWPIKPEEKAEKKELEFIRTTKHLQERRRVPYRNRSKRTPMESFFELSNPRGRLRTLLKNHLMKNENLYKKKQTHVTVGPACFMPPSLRVNNKSECKGHTLLAYNF